MRKLIYSLLFFSFIPLANAQVNYGNEWIDPELFYYKIPVNNEGVHRISYAALQSAGFPVNADPRSFKMFARGAEIPIWVQGESDGVFAQNEFIEFIGIPSWGELDSLLYNEPGSRINSRFGLYSDSLHYFLTVSNQITGNKRFSLENDQNTSAYPSAPYYWARIGISYNNAYNNGRSYEGNTQDPFYAPGEGYAQIFNGAATVNQAWNGVMASLQSTIYTAGPDARLSIRMAGANDPTNTGIFDHRYIITFGNAVIDSSIANFGFSFFKLTSSAAALQASPSAYIIQMLTTFASNTRNALGSVSAEIPQTFNLGNRTRHTLYVPDNPAESKYALTITGFNSQNTPVRVYDLTNSRRINMQGAGTNWSGVLANGNGIKHCYISSDASLYNVSALSPVKFNDSPLGRFKDFKNSYRDYNYIIVTVSSFWSQAQNYAAFRQLSGYNTLVVDAEQLYYQFGFGIPKHPAAIKNFLRFATDYWAQKPEFLFIIGKAYFPTTARSNASVYSAVTVPAIGTPPADMLYGYNIRGNKRQDISVGRLSAVSGQQVSDYLQKVMEQEVNAAQPFTKNILHFGGGGSQQENQILAGYLNGFKETIEDTLYGGKVNTFLKNSNVPFQNTLADSVRNSINRGVALMTFFGHASGTGFDVYVDEPSEYDNRGKYPLMIANSCFSGDLFQGYQTTSEKFVLQPGLGAWGFIATVSTGVPPFMNLYTGTLYEHLSYKSYGKPVGICMKNTSNELYELYGDNAFVRIVAGEMTLHGDPACRLNDLRKPDLAISEQTVSYDPGTITTDLDSFNVQVVISNLGRTFTDSFNVEIVRKYAKFGKADDVYNLLLPPVNYLDTVIVRMPVDRVNGTGLNFVSVSLDPPNVIDELTNTNNNLTKTLFISTGEILPVYPGEFSVIPNNKTWLRATTGDPFAPEKKYKFEVDTTDLFNSPFKIDTVIQQVGGVVKWRPSITLTDSTVYFWRTGVDSANSGNFYRWKESSFQHIAGKRGWGQDHFFQFKDNFYDFINYNRPQRKFDFVPNQKALRIQTYGNTSSPTTLADCFYTIDGVPLESNACGTTPSIHVFVIDPITLVPWGSNCNGFNPSNSFGNANDLCACRQRVEGYFIFRQTSASQRANLVNFLNIIPNGHYVGIYTMVNTQFQNFNSSELAVFSSLGADSVAALAAGSVNKPWAFFTRKGFPSTKVEKVGPLFNSKLILDAVLENDWIYGNIGSPLIGPASSWGSFHYKTDALETPTFDSASVDIIGITGGGAESPLITGIPLTQPEILNLGDLVDAQQYPYLKLRFFTRDNINQTPSQLNRWHVLYEGVPEAALNPSVSYYLDDDTLQQGKTISFSTAIENIGDYSMDSLWIRYFIINQANQITSFFKKADSLRVNAFITDTFTVSNLGFPGKNALWIEANPINHPQYQREQYHFNNLGERNFFTTGDKINPLLEVMFDGARILDGEIVSAKPMIEIKLKDENPILLLTDTTAFDVYLQTPGQSTPKRIALGAENISFYPATGNQNMARIEYRADFSAQDGKYKLMVRARDASNNSSGKGSGDFDYVISFEVVNAQTITEVLNYPNPFSTSTRFVFTLTGAEVPDFMKIQIFTIDGRIVREIFMHELGPIRIGKNITDYAWDGTDEFGDKLASGVYLYRVFTKDNGETVEKSATSADRFFKKGFGKMYLMR